jgi:hypothetical protein
MTQGLRERALSAQLAAVREQLEVRGRIRVVLLGSVACVLCVQRQIFIECVDYFAVCVRLARLCRAGFQIMKIKY